MGKHGPWHVLKRPAVGAVQAHVQGLCLMRAGLGVLSLWHLRPFVERALDGVAYGDVFFVPWFSWYPVLGRGAYFGLLWCAVACAALMTAGLWSRWTTWLTWGVLTFHFFLSETFFHNNRHFLLMLLLVVALGDNGAAFSVDAWWARRRHRPSNLMRAARESAFAVAVGRCLVVFPYLGSGLSKLLDPDWWGGRVTWDRVLHYRHVAEAKGAPVWVMDVLCRADVHGVLAKALILTELSIPFLLWLPRTRRVGVAVVIGFHLMIQLTASVQIFSWLGILATLLWLPVRWPVVRASTTEHAHRVGRLGSAA